MTHKFKNWIFLLLLIQPGHIHAQLNQFFGGNNKLRYRGALSYEGASALGEMADISTLYSATGSIFGNPAGIVKVNRLQIQADVSMPGLRVNTSTRKSEVLRSMVREGLDDFLMEEGVEGKNRVDPEISADMAQTPGLEGLGVTFRTNHFVWPVAFTGAVERLVDFQFDLEMNNVDIGIALPMDDSDPASDSIKAKFNAQTVLSFSMGLNRRGLGMAVEIPGTSLKIGLSAYQYMGYFNFDAAGEINGFISRNLRESYFNLETSPYTDDLSVNYLGAGRGSAAGFGFGLNWMPFKHFGIDLAANWNGNIENGSIAGEHYTLNAIDNQEEKKSVEKEKTDPDKESELFQISKLNLTKLTLTKKVTNKIENVVIQLPSRLGASFCLDFRKFKLNLDYAWYYRSMNLSYDHTTAKTAFDQEFNDVILKTDGSDSIEVETGSGRLGSYLTHKAALGMSAWGFFLNTGAYIGNPSIFYQNDNNIGVRFMPILNIGYSFRSRRKVTLDFSVIQLPMTIFKTTVKYRI